MKDNLGLALFLILSSQRVLLTSAAVESSHQKRLVVVLLTDYHVTACNKGCRLKVSNNYDDNYGNLLVYFVFLTAFHKHIC